MIETGRAASFAYAALSRQNRLKNAPYKSYIEVGEGTHTLMLEKNRMQLFRPVQALLEDSAP